MNESLACEALKNALCMAVNYDGYDRIIEVHTVGYTKKNNLAMRVWQVRGGSSSGEYTGWKLMTFDKVTSARITDEASKAPRDGYKKSDEGMSSIIREI